MVGCLIYSRNIFSIPCKVQSVFIRSSPLSKPQEYTTNKFFQMAVLVMAVGLLIQLAGKILYTSSGANNSHIYLLFIAPSVVASIWLVYKHLDFFLRK